MSIGADTQLDQLRRLAGFGDGGKSSNGKGSQKNSNSRAHNRLPRKGVV